MDTQNNFNFIPWMSVWTNEKKDEYQYYKRDGTSITITVGTWLLLPGRTDRVIVDKLYSLQGKKSKSNDTSGPCGITYLPWRENENRFANLSFSMRGNDRFIVCYPEGRDTYGTHIDWDKVEVCTQPDIANEHKEKFQEQVDDIIHPMPELIGSDYDEN